MNKESKVRITKAVLAQLPEQLAEMIAEWKREYHKAHFSVEDCTEFYAGEDDHLRAFSPDFKSSARLRVAGEWAGLTGVTPGDRCPLPVGCVVAATGIFCGWPWLHVYTNQGLKLT